MGLIQVYSISTGTMVMPTTIAFVCVLQYDIKSELYLFNDKYIVLLPIKVYSFLYDKNINYKKYILVLVKLGFNLALRMNMLFLFIKIEKVKMKSKNVYNIIFFNLFFILILI